MTTRNSINALPSNATQATPAEAVWYARIAAWVKEASSDDETTRANGRLYLSLLTRPLALAHLPELWEVERRRQKQRLQFQSLILCLYLSAIVITGLLKWLHPQLHGYTWPIFIFQGLSLLVSVRTWAADRFSRGLIYALVQHQNVELTPLLVEALARISATVTNETDREPLRKEVRAALTHLLPRFTNADLPALNERQRRILENQLTLYAGRLRDARAALTPEEADFLAAVLATLQLERSPSQARKRVLQSLDTLATERHDPLQEPKARTRVREAAYQSIVRVMAA